MIIIQQKKDHELFLCNQCVIQSIFSKYDNWHNWIGNLFTLDKNSTLLMKILGWNFRLHLLVKATAMVLQAHVMFGIYLVKTTTAAWAVQPDPIGDVLIFGVAASCARAVWLSSIVYGMLSCLSGQGCKSSVINFYSVWDALMFYLGKVARALWPSLESENNVSAFICYDVIVRIIEMY